MPPKQTITDPPVGFWQTIKFLGPGFILVGSVVGSGEIILTTTLGATVGFVMLWWMLISCWGKSIVQAELGRYAVSSGETALTAFNRLPGKLPGPRRKISWFMWLWLLTMIPGHLGGGGIYGGTGQALNMMLPVLESKWWTIIVAATASLIVISGTYRFLEKLLTCMVVTFTFITLCCAVSLQFTEFAITWSDVKAGLNFEFPAFAVAAGLAAYGGTGVNAGESMAYTYWCVEKGYAKFVGKSGESPNWLARARGWTRVMQIDVVLTLVVLTFATVPFYMLGAGVLSRNKLLSLKTTFRPELEKSSRPRFGLELSSAKDLNQHHHLPDRLRRSLTDQGLQLSRDTKILVEDKNKRWQIVDATSQKTYLVRKEKQKLNIYDSTSVSLRQQFERQQLFLSVSAIVTIETEGRRWKIIDTDTQGNEQKYIIRQEDGLLNIYKMPNGIETISTLSEMYTQTLGNWARWLFMFGAFFVLFSTVVSGLGGGTRMFVDGMTVLGLVDPTDQNAQRKILRIWAVVSPAIMSACYFFVENPVWMLTISGVVGAMMMPIVAGNTIYLRYHYLDQRITPSWKSDLLLWTCFMIMVILAGYVIYGKLISTS